MLCICMPMGELVCLKSGLLPTGERGDVHAGELSRRQHFCRAAQQSCRERESRETALCEQGAQHVLATSDGAVGARVLRLVPPTQPVLAYERVVARQSTS